jgi:putative PIN family toxin of toxin-antitoxin system
MEEVRPVARKIVLDTNVVLDWLLFRLPALEPLSAAAVAGRIEIATHALLFEELHRVLERPQIARYTTDVAAVTEAYRAHTTLLDLDPALLLRPELLPNGFPRCRDPDDDKFMAFAWHVKAGMLVSKDRELLKLRKRSRPFDITILTIEEMLRSLEPDAGSRRKCGR